MSRSIRSWLLNGRVSLALALIAFAIPIAGGMAVSAAISASNGTQPPPGLDRWTPVFRASAVVSLVAAVASVATGQAARRRGTNRGAAFAGMLGGAAYLGMFLLTLAIGFRVNPT